jgi:hypothetical protein
MSTRKSAPEEIPEGWEKINQFAFRMVVPGGWIYDITGRGILLVPERSVDRESVPAASGSVDDSGVGGPIVE